MPFREVTGSVLYGSYDVIAVETTAIKEESGMHFDKETLAFINGKGAQYAHEHYLASGMTFTIEAAPYWESAQEYVCNALRKSVPVNDIVISPAPDESSPKIMHILKKDWQRGTVQDIREIYADIMTCANEIGAGTIAIPVIGKTEGSPNREDNLIAEDFFVNYFMKTNSDIKIDLFAFDYMGANIGKNRNEAGQRISFNFFGPEFYINKVVEKLNDSSRVLFLSFPTLEKLDTIWFDHNNYPGGKMKMILNKGVCSFPVSNETLKKYEYAAKALEKALQPVTGQKPEQSPETIPQNISGENTAKLISEKAAMELIDEYSKTLNKEFKESQKSEEVFYQSKSASYILRYKSSQKKLVQNSGISRHSIYRLRDSENMTLSSSGRAVALAAALELEGYDFYVFAVSADPDHSFPETPEDIFVWRCVASGITGTKELDKILSDFSSKYSLSERVKTGEKKSAEKR